jgi:hypothetical protein
MDAEWERHGVCQLAVTDSEMAEGQVTCHTQSAHRRIYGTIKISFNQTLFECHL